MFEVETQRFVFLKDQWRATVQLPELDTYRRLRERNASFIATPVPGRDIHTQRTQSQGIPAAPRHQQTACRARPHLPGGREASRDLLRLVASHRICRACSYGYVHRKPSSTDLRLISIVLLAHMNAWERAGVLHHDISPGNIMIVIESGESFLNDYDLAKLKGDILNGVNTAEPVGVSVGRILADPTLQMKTTFLL